MPQEKTEEMPNDAPSDRIYLQEVPPCLHEASHLAVALEAGIKASAEIKYPNDVVMGGPAGMAWTDYKTDSVEGILDGLSIAIASVEMTNIYHLNPQGLGGDWQNVKRLMALLEKDFPDFKVDGLEQDLLWNARVFIVKHKDQIFKLAHALQTRRKLNCEEAARIYWHVEEVIVPKRFLDAVDKMPIMIWGLTLDAQPICDSNP